jgi:hypothetical protein
MEFVHDQCRTGCNYLQSDDKLRPIVAPDGQTIGIVYLPFEHGGLYSTSCILSSAVEPNVVIYNNPVKYVYDWQNIKAIVFSLIKMSSQSHFLTCSSLTILPLVVGSRSFRAASSVIKSNGRMLQPVSG